MSGRATAAPAALGLVAALLLAAALAPAGCAAPGPGSPSDIIKSAVGAQSSLGSVRMRFESEFELKVPGGRRSAHISYDGRYEKPDRWRLRVRGPGGSSEVVIIGDRAFVKAPGSEAWTEKKDAMLEAGGSPAGLVESRYLESASNIRMVDRKAGSYHLSFDLDVAGAAGSLGLAGVDPGLFRGRKAGVEVWVLKGSMRIRKVTMRFSGDLDGPGAGRLSAGMEVEFSEFNQPVSIEPPGPAGIPAPAPGA